MTQQDKELDTTVRLARVRYFLDKGQLPEADRELCSLLDGAKIPDTLENNAVETCQRIMQCYRSKKEFQRIFDLFKFELNALKNNATIQFIMADACDLCGKTEDALAHLQKAIQLEPHKPDPYLLLGKILETRDAEAAILHYQNYFERSDAPFAAKTYVKKVRTLLKSNPEVTDFKTIRLAFIGNFTLQPLKAYLEATCLQAGIVTEFFFGGYDQHIQEMADTESELYRFDPQWTFLFLDQKVLLPELYNHFYSLSPEQRLKCVTEKMDGLQHLAKKFLDHSQSLLGVSDFLRPVQYAMGIYDSREASGEKTMIQVLNHRLSKWTQDIPSRLYRIDSEKVLTACGKHAVGDEKMRYLAKMVIPEKALPELAQELMRYIKPALGLTKKCLVLDLDNTLWGGILGEDGLEGIQLGIEPPGNAFYEFQKAVKVLQRRGILLAINSKNNFDLVREAFEKHPDMQLRLDDFACIRANWQDKARNMREIALDLNIGLDSLVYMDDNPAERLLMRQEIPEVWTVEMPEDFSNFRQTLLELDVFEVLNITEEDRKRTDLYRAEAKRKGLKAEITDLRQYLESLAIVVEIYPAEPFTIPRIAQLTQRTNQFNLTTRRYKETDIQRMAQSDDWRVYVLKSSDRFGDHGIVGVGILRQLKKVWEIDTFLLSCRVIGRGIEQMLLYHIGKEALSGGAETLRGFYRATRKNGLASSFYAKEQWNTVSRNDAETVYEWNLDSREISRPEHIKLKTEHERETA